MEKANEDRSAVRLYLLGTLDEGARLRLEERLLADDACFEELLASEHELFEEYLSGRLAAGERERFESFFLSTPERRRGLAFARAFRRYAAADATAENASDAARARAATAAQVPPEATRAAAAQGERRTPFWQRLFPSPALASLRFTAAWALLLVAFGAAALLYFTPWRDPRADAEQELARLNTAPAPEAERYFAVSLAPGLTRAGGETTRVRIPAGSPGALLRLERAAEPFDAYRAHLKSNEDARRSYTVNDLRPVNYGGARAVVLHVPARLLPPGDYQLRLAARAPGRADYEELATYNFRVTGD